MLRSLLTACTALALAAGTAWAWLPPERGSRTARPSDALAADSSLLETAQPETSRAEAPKADAAPTQPAPSRSSRARSARESKKERAATNTRAVEEPVPAAPQPAAPPVVAEPAPVPQSAPEPQPAPAQISQPSEPLAAAAPDMAPDFPVMRTLGGIGIVLSLMIGGFFATRRFAPQLLQKPAAQKNLKVVETLQMGDKRSIAIVQVGEKRLLLGNTSSRITLLASLDVAPESEPSAVRAEVTPKRAKAAGSFRDIFEVEKRPVSLRGAGAPKTITPDIRAKMRQLRESLEQ